MARSDCPLPPPPPPDRAVAYDFALGEIDLGRWLARLGDLPGLADVKRADAGNDADDSEGM